MTKTQAQTLGREMGAMRFDVLLKAGGETFLRETAASDLTLDEVAADEAVVYMHQTSQRVESKTGAEIFDAFVESFRAAGRRAYGNLPDVKAVRRLEDVTYKLNVEEKLARNRLAKWAVDFAENPHYAFEHGDSAMEAAATLNVIVRFRAILEHEQGGLDEAEQEAARNTFRAAQYPRRSTSMTSNAMAQYEGAAWAEWVRR